MVHRSVIPLPGCTGTALHRFTGITIFLPGCTGTGYLHTGSTVCDLPVPDAHGRDASVTFTAGAADSRGWDAYAPVFQSTHATSMDTSRCVRHPCFTRDVERGDKKSQPGFAPGSEGPARPCGTPGLPIAVDQGPVGGDPTDLPCGIPHDESSSGPDTSLV